MSPRWRSRFVAPPPDRPLVARRPPTFSIIIPAYQAASFVADAVESALAQTVAPREVIVCDDGSTDDLQGALAPYAEQVVLLHKEHSGVAATRNVAVQAATGDFVASLDADNAFLPEYLEAVSALATARPDLDILTTDAYLELDGQVYGRYYRGKTRFVTANQRLGIIHQHFVYANAAFRRESLVAIGGYDEYYDGTPYHGVEDTDLLLRMILRGARAGLVDEALAVYRIRAGSLSSNRARSLRGAVEVLERARKHPSLAADELAFLEEQLAYLLMEAGFAAAEEALRGYAGHARRRCLEIVFGRQGYGMAARMRALAAAVAPRTAAHYLERMERTTGRSRLALRTHGR